MKEQVFSKKAFKDINAIDKKHPRDIDFIQKELEKHLTAQLRVDGDKITNYTPTLFRLRINASNSYRVYFRVYEDCFFIERIVLKKDSDKILKTIQGR